MNRLAIFILLAILLFAPSLLGLAQGQEPSTLEECLGERFEDGIEASVNEGILQDDWDLVDESLLDWLFSLEGTNHQFLGYPDDVPVGKETILGFNYGFEGFTVETIEETNWVSQIISEDYTLMIIVYPDDASSMWITPMRISRNPVTDKVDLELPCNASLHLNTGLDENGDLLPVLNEEKENA